MTSAGPLEEMLDESWFAEQMDHNEGFGTIDKSKKPR